MPGDDGSVSGSTPTSGTPSASWLTWEDTASGSSRRTRASGQSIRTVADTSRSTGERSNGPGNSGDEGKCSAVPEHRGTGTSSAPQGLSERPTVVHEKEPLGSHTPRYNLRPRANKLQQARMPENKSASGLLQGRRNVPAPGNSKQKGEHVARSSRRGRKRQRQQSPSSSSSASSRTEEGPKPPPPISRDLRTTTGPKKLPKLDSRAENQALSNSAMSKEAPSTSRPSLKTSTVPMFERHGEEPFKPPKGRSSRLSLDHVREMEQRQWSWQNDQLRQYFESVAAVSPGPTDVQEQSHLGVSPQSSGERSNGPGNTGDEGKCSAVPEHRGTGMSSAPQGLSELGLRWDKKEPQGDPTPRYNLRPRAKKSLQATTNMPQNKTTSGLLQEKRNVPAAANSEQRLEQMPNSSRCSGKRKRVASPTSSASVRSWNEKRPKPPPLTSRDPRTTTGPKESPKPLSRAEKRALAKQAACRANYKRFMKEVYPELVKAKSPWAWSGISTTPDSPKSSQRSHVPGKRPLSETAEARLGRPSARPEGAPVGKRSYWYVPKALKDYKADEKPRETRRYKYRTPDPSSVDDSPIGTVKQPTYNFWQNSGRSWKRSTRPGPELLMESDGVEAAVNSLKAAAAKGSETSSPKAQSPRVSKLLERRGEEPPMPPKGVKRKAKDAFAQTDFTCMVGKSIRSDGAARKRLRETCPVREDQVQFRDMPMEEAGGGAGITFGNYFSTGTTAMGVMRLGPNSEKPTSANNEHDMFVYALDNGVKITTLGGTWMILPKGSTFFICRGMPFTLRNLTLTTAKVLYALTDPCEADSEA